MTRQIAGFAVVVAAVTGWAGWNGLAAYERFHAPGWLDSHVDLKSLGSFPSDAATGTTNDVPRMDRDLDGKPVVLEGFMEASTFAGDVRQFTLIHDPNQHWAGPTIQQRVFATVRAGAVPFSAAAVSVTGTLHVGVVRDADGRVASVFRMDVDKVDPL